MVDLAIMRRIEELHLEFPFAGSRMLRDLLRREGIGIGRQHVATLMKKMAIEAIYRRPNASKPTPGHKIYPYLLRQLPIVRPNQFVLSHPRQEGFLAHFCDLRFGNCSYKCRGRRLQLRPHRS